MISVLCLFHVQLLLFLQIFSFFDVSFPFFFYFLSREMPLIRFKVYGLIATALFQKCTECAEYLNKQYDEEFAIDVIKEMPRDVDDRKQSLLASGKLSRVRISKEELQRSSMQKPTGMTDHGTTLTGPTVSVSGHHPAVMNAEVLVVMERTECGGEKGEKTEMRNGGVGSSVDVAPGSHSTSHGLWTVASTVFVNEKKETQKPGNEAMEGDRIEEEEVLQGEIPTAQSGEAFLLYIQSVTTFRVLCIDPSHPDSYDNRALFSWKKFLHDRGNSYCWLSVKVGEREAGKITLELFSQMLPRTSTNFWRMCCGRGGEVVPEGEEESVVLSYKGTTFFRILKGAWIMGGDVSKGYTGTGGYSCYGRHFPDESFAVPHSGAGILGMCNDGEHSNASSFYITISKMSWMNGKYVAFGRVVDGMKTVEEIHSQPVKHNQSPEVKITIEDCGVLDVSM